MKLNFFATFLTIILAFGISNAQLVITEIMYNPPESGSDSLEFIEIHNAGDIMVSLEDYTLEGVSFTFPDFDLFEQQYVVVCVDSAVHKNVFGNDAFQWPDRQGLRNTGETISLLDNNGVLVDSVRYTPNVEWQETANGDGASLELCNPLQNNDDPFFWRSSREATGIFINGKEILASPGLENDVPCGDHRVIVRNIEFVPADITVSIGDYIEWVNVEGFHNVNGSLADYPNNPDGFSSGAPEQAPWSFIHQFNAIGHYDYHCDPHVAYGMTGTVTVQDADEIPQYEIAVVTTVDGAGLPDSMGVVCQLQGLVYGVDLQGSDRIQFALIDGTGGISVFGQESFGYEVQEGDDLIVFGEIDQFNGLTQLNVDSLRVVSTGNTLADPTIVEELNEDTESELIEISTPVYIPDPSQWRGDGSGFTVLVTDDEKDYNLRIDNDVELSTMPAPVGLFMLTGIGGQFDSSEPHDDGYQILPRYAADIVELIATTDIVNDNILVFPNPAQDNLWVKSDYDIISYTVTTVEGVIVGHGKYPEKTIDISALKSGLYCVQLTTSKGAGRKRFVRQ